MLLGVDGNSGKLLKKEFPELTFLELPGYRIQYSKKKSNLKWSIFSQVPKIIYSIIKEHNWLKKQIELHNIDVVISDNRFGLYNKNITTIYITHQLQIQTGSSFTDLIVQKLHYYFINKYSFCWIPDAKLKGLGGSLSHPKKLPQNSVYIGPVSRLFIKCVPHSYSILIILSGPEPQRSILENILLVKTRDVTEKIMLIRGIPGNDLKPENSNITVKDLVSSGELNELINGSDLVICRSGYSSLMDLAKLNKNAIIIPTPGQTEQEYLGSYLMNHKMFYSIDQAKLNSDNRFIETIKEFEFCTLDYDWDNYKIIIKDLIKKLSLNTH